jgi:hypothetical protein
MSSHYELEKKIWTEVDFPKMGWHDAPIYGMAFFSDSLTVSNELVFDLDYILQWINPVPPNRHFSFWIAPSTLVFKNIGDLNIQMDPWPPNTFDFEVLDIYRLEVFQSTNSEPSWKWHIELGNGNIYFTATGYEQIIKNVPLLSQHQAYPDRGASNFSRTTF